MPAWVNDQLYPLLPTAINVPREASRKPGGAAGHSNRGFAEPQRGGRKAEFSRLVIRCPVGGDGQGGEDPLAAFFAYFLSHHRK